MYPWNVGGESHGSRLTGFGVVDFEGDRVAECGVVGAHGVGDARAGEDEAVDGAESGNADQDSDGALGPVGYSDGERVDGYGVGGGHSGGAKSGEVGGVDEEVERGDGERADDERADNIAFGAFDLGGDVGHFVPAAEGEEDEYEG